jgi:hypothetical protein
MLKLFTAVTAVLVALVVALPALGEVESSAPTGKGWWHADCSFSHRLHDDPIVFPGAAGASHSHDFLGARNLTATSTNESIRRSQTSCTRTNTPWSTTDRSAYWVPTLYVDDEPVAPRSATAGYSAGFRDISAIEPYPDALKIIVGDARGLNPGGYQWRCEGATLARGSATVAPTCETGLHLALRFPDCWNGVASDSANHKSHMAFSTQAASGNPYRVCPSTHPVLVPELQLTIRYPTTGGPSTRLASGNISTAHADFMNGWDPDKLRGLVDRCMRADRYCGGSDDPVPGH